MYRTQSSYRSSTLSRPQRSQRTFRFFRTHRGSPRDRGPDNHRASLVDRLTQEGLLSLPKAYRKFGIDDVSVWAMLRHSNHGIRTKSGRIVRLETIKIGGRRWTSAQAVHRFVEAQNTDADERQTPDPIDGETRAADDKFLDSLGLGRDND